MCPEHKNRKPEGLMRTGYARFSFSSLLRTSTRLIAVICLSRLKILLATRPKMTSCMSWSTPSSPADFASSYSIAWKMFRLVFWETSLPEIAIILSRTVWSSLVLRSCTALIIERLRLESVST